MFLSSFVARGQRSSALQMSSRISMGVGSPRDKLQPIRGQFIGPVLCFPGPPVIHNMLMTLTLLIMAQQSNLKPCGAQG